MVAFPQPELDRLETVTVSGSKEFRKQASGVVWLRYRSTAIENQMEEA